MSTNARIRGHELQRIRRRHFALNPLCVMCERLNIVRLATELDHIIALANGGQDVESNRQGLCADCHAIKTAQDLGHAAPIKRFGCDANGMPIGADHPWNR